MVRFVHGSVTISLHDVSNVIEQITMLKHRRAINRQNKQLCIIFPYNSLIHIYIPSNFFILVGYLNQNV